MISVDFDKRQLDRLDQILIGTSRKLPNELRIIVNKTATKVRSSTKEPKGISQRIRAEGLAIKASDLKPLLHIDRATKTRLSAVVTLDYEARPSLKRFKPRQTKKGVTFKIDKREKRRLALSAFGPNIPKLGGHVYKREGKARLPITKLHGISPWAFYLINNMLTAQARDVAVQLQKQAQERIRFLLELKSGRIEFGVGRRQRGTAGGI